MGAAKGQPKAGSDKAETETEAAAEGSPQDPPPPPGPWSVCKGIIKEMDDATRDLLGTCKVNKIMEALGQRLNVALDQMPSVGPLPKWCCHSAPAAPALDMPGRYPHVVCT